MESQLAEHHDALTAHKQELIHLNGEIIATQRLLVELIRRSEYARGTFKAALDSVTMSAELNGNAPHLEKAIKVLEELRNTVIGKPPPKTEIS